MTGVPSYSTKIKLSFYVLLLAQLSELVAGQQLSVSVCLCVNQRGTTAERGDV